MVYDKVVNGLIYFKSKLPFLARKIVLRSDKTYIIPSGFGFAFSLLAMSLLVLAINSANNLIYLFAFFLISIALTGMLNTNKNIEAVKVIEIRNAVIFAQEKNQLPVKLKNKEGRLEIWDLSIEMDVDRKLSNQESHIESIKGLQEQIVLVVWSPEMRGLQKIPRLKIQSRFPFGMLKAWKYFEPNSHIIIFPQRKGQFEMPLQLGAADQHEAQSQPDTKGYFRDFRDYQKTDSPHRIDWKRSLKHQKHFVKNYETEGDKKILIDWQLSPTQSNFEDHISQLTLWVDLSHQRQELYSLKIFNYQSDFNSGVAHYQLCLEKLAFLTPQDLL